MSLRELLNAVGPKGHVFLTVFLVLPFLQPIPLPGVSTVFGITIAFVGGFMALGRAPWLPDRFGRVVVESSTLFRICSALEKIMSKLEWLVKPRGRAIFDQTWFRRTNGALLFVHGLIMAAPLPIPFSNFLPALVLFLVALGSLEEDVWMIVAGYFAVVVNAAFFAALVILPYYGIKLMNS